MDTHIKLLLLAAVLGVIAGAATIAWALGVPSLAPLLLLAFSLALGWRLSELEHVGKRLRLLFALLAALLLVSLSLRL